MHWQLVTKPLGWLSGIRVTWREVKTHKQRTLAARDLIVQELRYNAGVLWDSREAPGAASVPSTHFWPTVEYPQWDIQRGNVRHEAWDSNAADLGVLRKKNSALWNEIGSAYTTLRLARNRDEPGITH